MNDISSDISLHVQELCQRARPAGRRLAIIPDHERVAALESCAQAIEAAEATIIAANAKDLAAAKANELSTAMVDRLRLDSERLRRVVADLRAVAAQRDPLGRVLDERRIVQDLALEKIAVPIGVVAVIYESRPNVTVDAAALCLRSGNAVILRGGKEAVHSNRAFTKALRNGLAQSSVPADAVQLVMQQERELIPELLQREDAIDVVVPRGGEGLIRAVVAVSKIPVVKHDKGVCSLYVHAEADIDMAVSLVVNAKTQRPGVCNTIENLLIDQAALSTHLPKIAAALTDAGVELRCDADSLPFCPGAIAATDADWEEEYLELILSIKTVENIDAAIDFTNQHGSQHSDGIITANDESAAYYLHAVDSATVYHNASTRFTDGGQLGLGAEVGISTNRLHARGPMGIDELCTYKYIVRGSGQIRT